MIRFLPFLFLFTIGFGHVAIAQDSNSVYWFKFKDKQGTPYSVDNPGAFLSGRAIQRRIKQNIPVRKSDLPVNPDYIEKVKSASESVLLRSKWLNGVAALVKDSGQLKAINQFEIIDTSYRVKGNQLSPQSESVRVPTLDMLYGQSAHQIEMMNGHLLHQQELRGKGVGIAVLDAGFRKVHELDAFEHLDVFNLLRGTWDFVKQEEGVFAYSNHGSMVLSTMAGYLENNLMGTAPLADYWLLRSENTNSEFLIEEYSWIAAAEYADSVGAKIINSSLGYTQFDDSTTDHRYASLDGSTTPVSRGASMAARKGLLVVTSAGNQGNDKWQYISAPADADSVLTVGAVDSTRNLAGFSSLGPSVDGRTKPDVVAQGRNVFVVGDENDEILQGAGTSFSAPLVAGLAACLWEAFPSATNMQVRRAIIASASQAGDPDTMLGYGIPDFYKAHWHLKKITGQKIGGSHVISMYPNPFKENLELTLFSVHSGKYRLRIINETGQTVKVKNLDLDQGVNNFRFRNLSELSGGIYLLSITGDGFHTTKKVIKR